MPSNSTKPNKLETLFLDLYNAGTEKEVNDILILRKDVFISQNWKPIADNFSNYGIIENQQSNPIAALVEKVTNSMDAILTKKCLEAGIEPESNKAPKSMEDAIKTFFPKHTNWDIPKFRKEQAENIQILADGTPRDTSVIIYDDGEGQHPQDFPTTFLSLVRGNKNKIMFVQGKYNMGGSGAIVFCGKKGYQLVASKKFDGSGQFGFTLVREHPFEKGEQEQVKNTWYEYLTIDGKILSFDIDELDLNLLNRKFKTGSIIKMYSYQFPTGYYGFAQDLNQSLNEFLFEPVLPVFTIDNEKRYPNNKVLQNDLFGLKRRLEEDESYVEDHFSNTYIHDMFGEMKVTCYVFKAKVGDNDVKKTKENIRDRFFKNNMSVMFSINGQAHGSYSSEFITRQLKLNLLKDYLLIHVDCTKMKYEFRKDLFMASRDRLKQGAESNKLREYLGTNLKKSKLDEINKRRKDAIGFESEDTTELIKSFAKNLPKDADLFKLLQNTLKLDESKKEKDPNKTQKPSSKSREEKPFKPERFPSFFRLYHKKDGASIPVPVGSEKTLRFETDVEDHYFDRTEEPGDLQVSILTVKRNEKSGGGTQPGQNKEPGDLINIVKSSPNRGTIKITFNPNTELKQGEEIEVKASLKGAGDNYHDDIVWLKIVEPEAPKEKAKVQEEEDDKIGLPKLIPVTKDQWKNLEEQGVSMAYETVLYPVAEGDKLEKIYVNLDSKVFLDHRSKQKNEDQIIIAQKKYLASVYFHSLFLYMIAKKKGYTFSTMKDGKQDEIMIDEYIRDVFDSYYSDFLLNFGLKELMNTLED